MYEVGGTRGRVKECCRFPVTRCRKKLDRGRRFEEKKYESGIRSQEPEACLFSLRALRDL